MVCHFRPIKPSANKKSHKFLLGEIDSTRCLKKVFNRPSDCEQSVINMVLFSYTFHFLCPLIYYKSFSFSRCGNPFTKHKICLGVRLLRKSTFFKNIDCDFVRHVHGLLLVL